MILLAVYKISFGSNVYNNYLVHHLTHLLSSTSLFQEYGRIMSLSLRSMNELKNQNISPLTGCIGMTLLRIIQDYSNILFSNKEKRIINHAQTHEHGYERETFSTYPLLKQSTTVCESNPVFWKHDSHSSYLRSKTELSTQ